MSRKLTTISISEEVKEKLEIEKGDMSWGEFLLLLIEEYRKKKVERGIDKLREILTDEDIKKIEDSHKHMHEEFRI